MSTCCDPPWNSACCDFLGPKKNQARRPMAPAPAAVTRMSMKVTTASLPLGLEGLLAFLELLLADLTHGEPAAQSLHGGVLPSRGHVNHCVAGAICSGDPGDKMRELSEAGERFVAG